MKRDLPDRNPLRIDVIAHLYDGEYFDDLKPAFAFGMRGLRWLAPDEFLKADRDAILALLRKS